eukprot:CAMPEP_0201491758 /NCGR_PEP_ID=MMETSP0151_2-20130828/31088_1 /ASSEMBLY_ACC=CAM_ASM_000257 /TAXON_ID=200890 /ORGANISM="Paramoeba atlantica, Strain 621/1 / CCAP 1560/9" /LENGTH=312 /DNA_ID=CAMNT_0047878267 /DNA_START=66 /DNA_END=1004 /DNA_ORIENTATION=+
MKYWTILSFLFLLSSSLLQAQEEEEDDILSHIQMMAKEKLSQKQPEGTTPPPATRLETVEEARKAIRDTGFSLVIFDEFNNEMNDFYVPFTKDIKNNLEDLLTIYIIDLAEEELHPLAREEGITNLPGLVLYSFGIRLRVFDASQMKAFTPREIMLPLIKAGHFERPVLSASAFSDLQKIVTENPEKLAVTVICATTALANAHLDDLAVSIGDKARFVKGSKKLCQNLWSLRTSELRSFQDKQPQKVGKGDERKPEFGGFAVIFRNGNILDLSPTVDLPITPSRSKFAASLMFWIRDWGFPQFRSTPLQDEL